MPFAGGLVHPAQPAFARDQRQPLLLGGRLVGGVALLGAQRPQHLADAALTDAEHPGDRRGVQALAALVLGHPPELSNPLGVGQLPAPQRRQGLRGVGAAHADLAGKRGRVQVLAVANLAGPPCLLDALQRTGGRLRGRLDLGTAPAGEGGLQPGELVRGWLAVAGRLGAQRRQARVARPGDPQGVQPLLGGPGGGADLTRELGRIQRCAAAQLTRQVRLADPVADQPPAQLPKVGVALPLGAQHAHQVAGQSGGDADLGRQGGGVHLVAAVDLTRQPGVGDPLPRRPRVRRRLGGRRRRAGEVLSGHRAPPPARPAADHPQGGG